MHNALRHWLISLKYGLHNGRIHVIKSDEPIVNPLLLKQFLTLFVLLSQTTSAFKMFLKISGIELEAQKLDPEWLSFQDIHAWGACRQGPRLTSND